MHMGRPKSSLVRETYGPPSQSLVPNGNVGLRQVRHWRPLVDMHPAASHEVAGLPLKSERLLKCTDFWGGGGWRKLKPGVCVGMMPVHGPVRRRLLCSAHIAYARAPAVAVKPSAVSPNAVSKASLVTWWPFASLRGQRRFFAAAGDGAARLRRCAALVRILGTTIGLYSFRWEEWQALGKRARKGGSGGTFLLVMVGRLAFIVLLAAAAFGFGRIYFEVLPVYERARFGMLEVADCTDFGGVAEWRWEVARRGRGGLPMRARRKF